MAWLKDRVDGLNFAEFQLPGYRANSFDLTIQEIRFRHNLVAVLKGDNSEPSNVNDPHPAGYVDWVQNRWYPHMKDRTEVYARRLRRELTRALPR